MFDRPQRGRRYNNNNNNRPPNRNEWSNPNERHTENTWNAHQKSNSGWNNSRAYHRTDKHNGDQADFDVVHFHSVHEGFTNRLTYFSAPIVPDGMINRRDKNHKVLDRRSPLLNALMSLRTRPKLRTALVRLVSSCNRPMLRHANGTYGRPF